MQELLRQYFYDGAASFASLMREEAILEVCEQIDEKGSESKYEATQKKVAVYFFVQA